jgi:hypothetical protein
MKSLLLLTACLAGVLAVNFQLPMKKVSVPKSLKTLHLRNKALESRYASKLASGSQTIADDVSCVFGERGFRLPEDLVSSHLVESGCKYTYSKALKIKCQN